MKGENVTGHNGLTENKRERERERERKYVTYQKDMQSSKVGTEYTLKRVGVIIPIYKIALFFPSFVSYYRKSRTAEM